MKRIFLYIAIVQSILGLATDYYVSLTGNNSNPGTFAAPFRTIQKGADVAVAGDVVYIRGGEYVATNTYTPLLLFTKAGGTATAPIKFRNYPGETVTLRPYQGNGTPSNSGTWALIKVQGSESTPNVAPAYLDFEGLVLHGRTTEINPSTEYNNLENQPGSVNHICSTKVKSSEWVRYNGQGMVVTGPFAWATDIDGLSQYCIPHHINVRNCVFKEFPGAGISFQRFDYVSVENCEIANNCWYTIFGSTGLNLYQATKYSQNLTSANYINTYSIKLLGNKIYGNTLKVLNQNIPSPDMSQVVNNPKYVCPTPKRWDGNGIIVDNFDHDQDNLDGRGPFVYNNYPGNTLIANNLVFGNGGSGIKAYTSDNISIFNNTLYENGIGNYEDQNGLAVSGNNILISNNISYNVSNTRYFDPQGSYQEQTTITSNPGFVVNPISNINYFTDLDVSNDNNLIPDISSSFKLASNSICVDAGNGYGFCSISGCEKSSPDNDYYHRRRVWDIDPNNGIDIGAIEYIPCVDYIYLGGLADPNSSLNQKINSGELALARAQKAIIIQPNATGQSGYTNSFTVDYGAVFTGEIVTCANANNARKAVQEKNTTTTEKAETTDNNCLKSSQIQ